MAEHHERRKRLINEDILTDPLLSVDDKKVPTSGMIDRGGLESLGLSEGVEDNDDLVEPLEPFDEAIDTEFGQEEYDHTSKPEDEDPIRNPIVNDPTELISIDLEEDGELDRTLMDPAKNDKLLTTVRNDSSLSILYNGIMEEICEDIAYLKLARKEAFLAREENFVDISFKRIKSLRELVEILVKREQGKSKQEAKIDFNGDAFQNVLKFFLKTISDTFEKVSIPQQFIDIFFAQLGQELEGFEKKIEKIYYGKK